MRVSKFGVLKPFGLARSAVSSFHMTKALTLQQPVTLTAQLRSHCSTCNLRELCMPIDLSPNDMQRINALTMLKRGYSRGDYLYHCGDPFHSLYAIRSGSFKTQVLHEDGREQVTGFQMTGEIIGMDAISTDVHTCDAIAMESSEVCALPFNQLEAMSRELPSLQRHLHKIMSREIVRDQGIMLLLGSMRAEERLAAFLLNFSQRLAARGFSPSQFQLRMSRQEIGSYLGLKLETVSRAFSHFQNEGIINVKVRSIEILDLARLQACLKCSN